MKSLSRVRLFVTPWTVAHQIPLSMGFSRQEYWSGLPFPSPGDLPDPGIEPRSPTLQADALTSEPCNSVLRQESWTNPRARFSFQSHHTLERRTVGTEVSKAKCFLKTVFREIQKRKKKLETIPNWM